MLETPVSQRMELEFSQLGGLAMRNNVGGWFDKETGRLTRYGLLNDGRSNGVKGQTTVDTCKSSDWICILPVTITPDMVGQRIGVFCALETKRSDWKLTPGDKHGQAQLAYHQLVKAYGGFAGFVTCNADVRQIIGLR